MIARSAAPVSVEEYLTSVYRPDCDYVDGQVEERNLGEWDHSWLQTTLVNYLFNRRKQWDILPVVEQRVQVALRRFRVPDICILLGSPTKEQILTKPPFVCIEILSPEDRMGRVQQRVTDYLNMGVPFVWVLDPKTRQAYAATGAKGLHKVKGGVLRTRNPVLEVPLQEVFDA